MLLRHSTQFQIQGQCRLEPRGTPLHLKYTTQNKCHLLHRCCPRWATVPVPLQPGISGIIRARESCYFLKTVPCLASLGELREPVPPALHISRQGARSPLRFMPVVTTLTRSLRSAQGYLGVGRKPITVRDAESSY